MASPEKPKEAKEYAELHRRFKDDDSPSPEAQMMWLQKQGFAQHHIDQAFWNIYGDLEIGKVPQVFEHVENGKMIDIKYGPSDVSAPSHRHKARPVATGWEFDQALLEAAKMAKTNEYSAILANMKRTEKKMRKKWMAQVPWYKRIFGVKPKETAE